MDMIEIVVKATGDIFNGGVCSHVLIAEELYNLEVELLKTTIEFINETKYENETIIVKDDSDYSLLTQNFIIRL
jgi:hypothetical protein